MSAMKAPLTAAGLPATPPIPSETWECLRVRPSRLRYGALSDDTVLEIRQRYATGLMAQAHLAELYGVHQSSISDIVRGVTYREVQAA